MVLTMKILGWMGILLYLIIIIRFKDLKKNNEFALLHLLLAFVYASWLALPILLFRVLGAEILLIGSIFDTTYLILLMLGMILQAGLLAFIHQDKTDPTLNENRSIHMMAILSDPYESFINIFKCIWVFFLAITFWQRAE